MIIVKAILSFLLGVFAFGAMFAMGNYVIDTLEANITVYYPNVLLIINYTLSLMIAGSVILYGLKKSNITTSRRYGY